jgi:hypothetical protein
VTALAWLDQSLGTPHDLEAPFILVASPSRERHRIVLRRASSVAANFRRNLLSRSLVKVGRCSNQRKEQLSGGFCGCRIGQDSDVRRRHAIAVGVLDQVHGFVGEMEQAFLGA